MQQKKSGPTFRGVSAARGTVKKPPGAEHGGPLYGYFYTGRTLIFGHYPPKKKGH